LLYQNPFAALLKPILGADRNSSIPPARKPFVPMVVHEIVVERSRRWLMENPLSFVGSGKHGIDRLGFSIGNQFGV